MREFKPEDMDRMIKAGKTPIQVSVAKWKVITTALERGHFDVAKRTFCYGAGNCALCHCYLDAYEDCKKCPLYNAGFSCTSNGLYRYIGYLFFLPPKKLPTYLKLVEATRKMLETLEEIARVSEE